MSVKNLQGMFQKREHEHETRKTIRTYIRRPSQETIRILLPVQLTGSEAMQNCQQNSTTVGKQEGTKLRE